MATLLTISRTLGSTPEARVYAGTLAGDTPVPCAVKGLLGSEGEAELRAEAELRRVARHPALAHARAWGMLEDRPAILLAPMDGTALDTLPTPPLRAALDLCTGVGEALLDLDIVPRRALLPRDVLVGAGGAVSLLGLGSGPRLQDADDPRATTFAIGALLLATICGATPPTRLVLEMAYDRALRRLLEAADVPEALSGLLRRMLAMAPARRPWPEVALSQLQSLASAPGGLDLAAWMEEVAPQEVATPSEPRPFVTEIAWDQAGAHQESAVEGPGPDLRFAVADDQELLFLPDTTAERLDLVDQATDLDEFPEAPAAGDLVVSDHAAVVHFPPLFYGVSAEGALASVAFPGDATDPSLSERTDPEAGGLAEDDQTTPGEDDAPGEALEVAEALVPGPAPQGVRLGPPPTVEAPQRRKRAGWSRWLVLGTVVLLAAAAGAAIA